jgi:undecaprenyl-diphosphatase
VPLVFGWQDQGLPHDVAAHAGSLAAVLVYFRADLAGVVMAPLRPAGTAGGRLLRLLVVGTIPAIIAGALLHEIAATVFRSPLVVATTTVSFGILLWWADRSGAKRRGIETIAWRDALLIGVAQCLALVPGTSRSGITMTAGLLLGLDRRAAARFSFLLSAPTILLAVIWEGRFLLTEAGPVDWVAVGITTFFSAVCALLTIHYFLKFLERTGMAPYVIYRLLLGTVLFAVYL